jgi:hypothetical protein
MGLFCSGNEGQAQGGNLAWNLNSQNRPLQVTTWRKDLVEF